MAKKGECIKYNAFSNRVTTEEIKQYYVIENHSKEDCLTHFNVTVRIFNDYLKQNHIKKDMKLTAQLTYKTKELKYGDGHYNNSEKRAETCMEKFNAPSPLECKEIWEKTYKTTISKYGGTGFQLFDSEKRYTVACKANSIYWDLYYSDNDFKQNVLESQFNTKKNNGTFNSSKAEDELYLQLCNQYGVDDIIHPYINDSRYPFECDFYIISEDKFIELNRHWTHGGKSYDENDPICQEQLKEWLSKSIESDFYKLAIDVWTRRDVIKLKTAKENNLNYEIIW